ncbi:hypothetical protein GCM10028811_24630 [Uliginosibacterium sediminicola]
MWRRGWRWGRQYDDGCGFEQCGDELGCIQHGFVDFVFGGIQFDIQRGLIVRKQHHFAGRDRLGHGRHQ